MNTRTAIATLALLTAATTGCGSQGSDPKPATAASPGPSSTAPKLSTTWGPKLNDAVNTGPATCNLVGDTLCAHHLTDIAIVVGDLRRAIEEASAADAYPRSMAEITAIDAAVEAYTDHECLDDPNAGMRKSPCPDDAQAIMTGGAVLRLALEVDELSR